MNKLLMQLLFPFLHKFGATEDGEGGGNEVIENNEPTAAEIEAKQFGWVPQEDFKGNPEDWKDADTFLRRGKEINGYLRKDLEKIQKTLSQRDSEIAEIRATMEDFRKFHNETESRAYARALADLKKSKVEAIEQGDGARVVEIDDEIDKIKEAQTKPTEKKQQPTQDNGAWQEWNAKNPWYGQDRVLTALANGLSDEVKAANPNLVGVEFLNEVTRLVKAEMPEKFENPARENSVVSGSGNTRSAPPSRKKGYNDLPAEAKVACDKFVKQKIITQEQYIKEYFGE